MASGHVYRANRPNTSMDSPACARGNFVPAARLPAVIYPVSTNSTGHQRRLLISLRRRTTEFPPVSGSERPCRDAGVGEIALGLAMLKRANALYTLIHHRRLTPSCGEHASTAERTMDPAKDVHGELDPTPGIREQPGSFSTDLHWPH